jgi:hypothetical protein
LPYVITMTSDILLVTISEALTPEDLTGMMQDADEIEKDLDPVPHRLTTSPGPFEVRVGYREVRAFAWHRREIVFPNVFRSAIVVRTPVERGIARMFQTLNDNPQIVIEIFDNDKEALAWLRQ